MTIADKYSLIIAKASIVIVVICLMAVTMITMNPLFLIPSGFAAFLYQLIDSSR